MQEEQLFFPNFQLFFPDSIMHIFQAAAAAAAVPPGFTYSVSRKLLPDHPVFSDNNETKQEKVYTESFADLGKLSILMVVWI